MRKKKTGLSKGDDFTVRPFYTIMPPGPTSKSRDTELTVFEKDKGSAITLSPIDLLSMIQCLVRALVSSSELSRLPVGRTSVSFLERSFLKKTGRLRRKSRCKKGEQK